MGSPENDDTNTNTGSVYIFNRSGSTWSPVYKPTLTTAGAEYGRHVAISGFWAAASSTQINSNIGELKMFKRDGATWSLTQTIAPSTDTLANVGIMSLEQTSSDISGRLFVSERSSSNKGKVYIYEYEEWTEYGTSPGIYLVAAGGLQSVSGTYYWWSS